MQEFASRNASPPAPPTEHWPTDEELAAYIDGTLGKAESKRITEHLASCEDCYAVYVEAVRFQLETEPEAELGKVVTFPSKRVWPDQRWLAAAAALLSVALGSWYAFQNALLGPAPKLLVADLAQPIQERSVQSLLWDHSRFRGEGEAETELERQSFQVGALLVDFRLSTQAEDVDNTSESWRSIGRVVSAVTFMSEDGKQILAQANQIESVPMLRRVAATADAREKSLGDSVLIPEYLDFGKWTEAGRVAALTANPIFFQERKNRRFLAYVLRDKEIEPKPETRRELEEIAKIWDQGELERTEYDSLVKHFQNILDQYDFTA